MDALTERALRVLERRHTLTAATLAESFNITSHEARRVLRALVKAGHAWQFVPTRTAWKSGAAGDYRVGPVEYTHIESRNGEHRS